MNAIQTGLDSKFRLGLETKVGNSRRLLIRRVTGFHVHPHKLILVALGEGRGWGKAFGKV